MAPHTDPTRPISPWTVVLFALVCLVAGFGLMGALSTVAGGGDGAWNIGAVFWGIANLFAAGLVVAGALQADASRRRGTALLALGAIAMAGLWYWAWMVSVPFAAVLISVAVVRALKPGASALYLNRKV